ncbi:hypothetical protein PIB30_105455 [Stylosanthes scabra]|uniref:Uncharacterized protein n=1 Tax=Stylosanthes scabra TaxID=79078 RepID=A0ABU6VZ38_9FABA|nr:hypothetical protein [Stylosanthes scabra]
MRGEDVRAEDIIADKIVRMAHGIKEKGKLGFPSTIYKICKEADSTRHKAYMDELAAMKAKQEEFFSSQVNQYNLIRQDHKLLGKEILDVKKYQMSAVTMGSSGLVQALNHHHHHRMSRIKP